MIFKDYIFLGAMFGMVLSALAVYDSYKGTSRLTSRDVTVYCLLVSLISVGASALLWWLR